MRNVHPVIGIRRAKPPILRMSVSSFIACITLPAPRNNSAFAAPCATRWNIAAPTPPAPSARVISPKWLTVEYAKTRLRSVTASASVPANTKVISPTVATTSGTAGASSNSGVMRAVR